jgi:protein CpxP
MNCRVVRWPARLFGLGLLLLSAGPLRAQAGPPTLTPTTGQPPESRRVGRPIEAELQRRTMAIMQERLALSGDQVARLAEVTRRFERERMGQRGAEYRLRWSLRRELMKADSASQERVAELLAQLPDVERRGIDLMEREQRELAQFLTPVQRARFLALQDEIQRSMEQLRQRRDSLEANQRGDRPPYRLLTDTARRGRP